MRRPREILTGLILFFLISTATALSTQVMGAESLTLDAAIELAARQNPEVLRARAAIEAATGRKLQAESFADPRLIYEPEEARGVNPGRFGSQKIGVSQNFELFGKRGLRGRIAAADIDVAGQELRRALLVAGARVRKAYWEAAAMQAQIGHLETTRGLLEAFLEATLARFEGGGASYADVARAKIEIAKVDNELSEVRALFENAKNALNVLLGRPGETSFDLKAPMRLSPETRSLDQIREAALRDRPSLLIAEMERKKSEEARRLARRSYLPDIELTGSYQRLRFEGLEGVGIDHDWSGVVALTFPFPGAKRQRGLVKEAEAERRRASIAREATARETSAAIERAYRSLRAAETQARRFEQSLLPDAEDALRSGIDSYQYGQIDSLSMLDIYRTYKETQIAHTRGLLAVLLAQADLEAAGEEEEKP